MKKVFLALFSLVLMASLVACGKKTDDKTTTGAKLKPGSYKVTATGYNKEKPFELEVVVSETAITEIKVVSDNETPNLGGEALKKLTKEIVEKQTLKVDAMSGATLTSKAIVEAVSKAYTEAGGDVKNLGL